MISHAGAYRWYAWLPAAFADSMSAFEGIVLKKSFFADD